MRKWMMILPLMVPCIFGCGKSAEPVTVHPVSGQVLYAGKPAVGVKVFLLPTSAPVPPEIPANPNGETGVDGRFQITTFTPNDGAAEGGYQVLLYWPKSENDYAEDDADQLMGWYDAKHSTLAVQIKAGTNQLEPFKLPEVSGPPAEVQGVPGRN